MFDDREKEVLRRIVRSLAAELRTLKGELHEIRVTQSRQNAELQGVMAILTDYIQKNKSAGVLNGVAHRQENSRRDYRRSPAVSQGSTAALGHWWECMR